ncbi:chaplin family protein [Streptomyces sp. NPDC005951]|uniref:chaplin family protein n=1 Tax=Streptomyces sp. NPDC005951 TaxID=3154573 RepID=UPI0033C1913A
MRKLQASMLLASIPVTLFSTEGAHATTIIGAGNSAHDNLCASHSGATASGVTKRSTGILHGLIVGLPGSGPTNQCGNLGLPYVPKNQIATRQQIYGDDPAIVPR